MILLEYQLGEGAYGQVYRGFVQLDSEKKGPFAFKIGKTFEHENGDQDLVNETIRKRMKREAEFLRMCAHPNIVKFYRTMKLREHQDDCLVLELLEHKFVNWVQKSCKSHREMKFVRALYEVVDALAYVHEQGYCHRDLKPDNIMVANGRPKLIDFGFVRNLDSVEPITKEVIGLHYRAPQVILGEAYTNQVDVWSLGCIFYLIAEECLPFKGANEVEILSSIIGKASEVPFRIHNLAFKKFRVNFSNKAKSELVFKTENPLLKDLILQMLRLDPRERPTMQRLRGHEFFGEVRREQARQEELSSKFRKANSLGKFSLPEIRRYLSKRTVYLKSSATQK